MIMITLEKRSALYAEGLISDANIWTFLSRSCPRELPVMQYVTVSLSKIPLRNGTLVNLDVPKDFSRVDHQ